MSNSYCVFDSALISLSKTLYIIYTGMPKLTSDGLEDDLDTTLVDTSGNAVSSSKLIATGSTTNTSASKVVKYAFVPYITGDIDYTYMSVNTETKNLTTNFRLTYTLLMRNYVYLKAEFHFACANDGGDHTFWLSSTTTNDATLIMTGRPVAGKYNVFMSFSGTGMTAVGFNLTEIVLNDKKTVNKLATGLLIGAGQKIEDSKCSQTVELFIFPSA